MLSVFQKIKHHIFPLKEIKDDRHQDILSDYHRFVDDVVTRYRTQFAALHKGHGQDLFKEYFKVFYDEAAAEAQRINNFYVAHGKDDQRLRNDMQQTCEQGLADFHALTMQYH